MCAPSNDSKGGAYHNPSFYERRVPANLPLSVKEISPIDSKKIALRIAQTARNKKAQKIVVLDMRAISGFCDFFVIFSGTSLTHINALANSIKEELAKDNVKPLFKSFSEDKSGWIAVDFSSVVAHIFYKPTRDFYALERLWSDAKRVRIPRKAV